MDRFFVGIYLKLIASLVVAALLTGVFIVPRIYRRVVANISSAMTPEAHLLAESLAQTGRRGEDLDQHFAQAARHVGAPTFLVRRAEVHLDPSDAALLDQGEAVFSGTPGSLFLHVRVPDTDRVVTAGPLLPVHPLGEGRIFAILVFVCAGLLVGLYLLLRPIRRRLGTLALAAEKLGGGDLQARAVVGPEDVIGRLATTFNRMADRIQRLLAMQQELLAVVSHELRTPLQRMQFGLEAVREPHGGTDRTAQFRQLDRDMDELGALVDELLTYARLKEGNLDRVPADLRPLLEEVAASLGQLPNTVPIEVTNPEVPLIATVDSRLVSRAVSNLTSNALRHAKTRVRIGATISKGAVTIDVDDDGEGVAEGDRERIFEPFQRLADAQTRARPGFGLGLAIVRRVAERHGGTVHALAADLGGARFRLSLPQTG